MKIRTILYPTDFSPIARLALDYAVSIARRYGATLIVLHCDEYSHMISQSAAFGYRGPQNLVDEIRNVSADQLNDLRRTLPSDLTIRTVHAVGRACHEIVEAAKREKADLIVMGTRGRSNLSSFFMGSNAERVVRHAEEPVLTVREHCAFKGFRKILFGVDFSSVSQAIMPAVLAMAREFDADLIAAHIDRQALEESVVEESFRHFLSSFDLRGVRLRTEIVAHSSVHGGLDRLSQSESADLIAIGTHGQTDVRKTFLGSTAEDVVNFSRVPVLTLRKGVSL